MSTRQRHSGRTELRTAAIKRRSDTWALLQAGAARSRAAGYLGGYVIECHLKAIAMEVDRCRTLEELAARWRVAEHELYTHGLEALAKRLPLYSRLRTSQVWRDFAGLVSSWRVSWRYDPRDWEADEARLFLEAVDRVYYWLERNS
jgi:hypothetical protein